MLQAAAKALVPVPVGWQPRAGSIAMERGAVAAPVAASAEVLIPAAEVLEAGPAPAAADFSADVATTLSNMSDNRLSFARGRGSGHGEQRQQLAEPAQAIAAPAEQPPATAAAVAGPTVLEGRRRRQRAHR